MSREIRRTVILAMVLITVFLIFSSGAFSRTFVRIDTEGLKNVHIRADIYEDNGGSNPGPKHGRIQVIIREETARFYNYKFLLDLRKVSKNTEYSIWAWTDLPNIDITIYGVVGSPNFWLIEWAAVESGIDKYGMDWKIDTSLELLGLEGYNEHDTGIDIMTNDRGTYKNIKAGSIDEMDAIEWLIDFGSPILKDQLINRYPEHTDLIEFIFGDDRNFAEFGIEKVVIKGGIYPISMGAKFKCASGDNYHTDEISFTHAMGDFVWEPPPLPPEP